MSTSSKIIDSTTEPLKGPYKAVWIVIGFAYLLSPAVMNLTNSLETPVLTAFWTVMTTFLILFIGLRPTNLVWSSILGGVAAFFMDTDKSQGAGLGPHKLWRIVITVAFTHFMMGLVATVWDFGETKAGFGAAWFIGLGFVLWNLYFDTPAKWFQRITLAVLAACVLGIVWESFNPDSATGENWFSDQTGEAIVVGFYDADGDFIPDPKRRKLSDCPKECFYKGKLLITPKPGDVPETSNFGLNIIIDAVTETEAERAAAKAVADAVKAKIIADQERRRKEADRLAQQKQAVLRPFVEDCVAPEFSRFVNCKRVTLTAGGGDYIYKRTKADYCPKVDDKRGIMSARNGMDIVLSLNKDKTSTTFHIFELQPGQKYVTRNGEHIC